MPVIIDIISMVFFRIVIQRTLNKGSNQSKRGLVTESKLTADFYLVVNVHINIS